MLFWALVGLGLIGLAPSVLLPEWRQYQALSLAGQVEESKLRAFEDQVERERRTLEALQSDPAVTARLALRELNYRRADEREVSVPVMGGVDHGPFLSDQKSLDYDSGNPAGAAVRPPALPGVLATVATRLPRLDYDRVFCDAPTRTIVMIMSTGLIAVAFALFGRAAEDQSSKSEDRSQGIHATS